MRANRRLHHLLAALHDRLLTYNADRVLFWAANNEKEGFFELAIARGADFHRPESGSNERPLFFAVRNGWDNSVKLLLSNGAHDTHDPSTHGPPSVLHSAVFFNCLSTTRLLLDLGWSPVSADNGVLHHAVLRGRNEIIKLLIERGANVNASAHGEGTLEVAARRTIRGLAVLKFLLLVGLDTSSSHFDSSRDIDRAFHESIWRGDGVMAKFLRLPVSLPLRDCPKYRNPAPALAHRGDATGQWGRNHGSEQGTGDRTIHCCDRKGPG